MQEPAESPKDATAEADLIKSLADKLLLSEEVFGIARLQWSDAEVLASPALDHGILISDSDFEKLARVYRDTQKRAAFRCAIASIVFGGGGCALLVVAGVMLEIPLPAIYVSGLLCAALIVVLLHHIVDTNMRKRFLPVYDALARAATRVTFPEALISEIKKEKSRERRRAHLKTITSAAASAVAGGATVLLGADKLAELAQSAAEMVVDHVLEQDEG